MKSAFSFILIIHGLIHLIGYVKAFFETDISKQLVGVSKPIGSIWLVTFIMFIVVSIQVQTGKKWFYLGLIAVLASQILIILAWSDAKFGTITNIVILLVSISAFASDRFDALVEKESKQILQNIKTKNLPIISENDIVHLPQIVQKWIINSGSIGNPIVQSVRLKQIGNMRTKPNSKWMPFEATQYFNVENPSFIWQTKVAALPLINIHGRDKLKDGKGEMLIKLAGLLPLVNASDNPKIDSSAMHRYLAEICWFPSAALSNYLSWEIINFNAAKATFIYKDQSVSGIFTFNDKGDLITFEAKRYYGGSENSKLEKWQITLEAYKVFHDIKIPYKSNVTWKFKEGDFNWLNLEVVALDYNSTVIY
ncbi:hypothetical protein DFQ09_11134 [Winogradskyella pacifica]|uniref:Uncharacterized protein n=1 Tax=Winogradskyella pacifica TaxID=664642 RepID=A0A3D9LMB0_9FLAO|nr:DUF6544 family protein [Winogradskyella pacifica]REE07704.1 hypothetical protein DFQ09_11134 [Winogradskyella pacifica]